MSIAPKRSSTTRLKLRVSPVAETYVRQDHPWVFSDSIREQNRPGIAGDFAVLYDRKDCFLAVGLFDPDSPIRVRILHAGKPTTIDDAFWQTRLIASRERRSQLFDTTTTGYRWIHGESDGWPGVVLDRYANTGVLKIYTAAWLPHLPAIVPRIVDVFALERLILRTSRNIESVAAKGPWSNQTILHGTPITDPIVFLETGLAFEADVLRGQKTGFFLDQRENRRWVESVARGRRVLNAFSFSGGFSLYAARGGAKSVTDLDLSAHALSSARRNFALNTHINTVHETTHEGIQTDAFAWLGERRTAAYDLVILDPPSLAKRETERSGAIQAYQKLVISGCHQLTSSGILLAASCSAHVSASEFFDAVLRGVRSCGLEAEELHRAQHPADHPARFPEAEYLKCIALKLRPRR